MATQKNLRSKKVFFAEKTFEVFEGVYEPTEDTFLLAENLQVRPSDNILEIGSGCGIISILAADNAKDVVAVDINPEATKCTRSNAKHSNVAKKISVVRGDLFAPFRLCKIFDLVVFNAPYLPSASSDAKEWIERAWAGGKNGRQLLDRFLREASDYIKTGGRITIVQSSLSNVNKTLRALKKNGFATTVIGEVKADFETITLIEATQKTTF